LLLHSIWVTLIVNADDVAVEELPMLAFSTLHWSEAGIYMCWPVLVPQICGGDFPPGTVTLNASVSQLPILLALRVVEIVMAVLVTGLFRTNVSKSSLS